MWRTRSLTADGGQSVGVWDRGRYRGRFGALRDAWQPTPHACHSENRGRAMGRSPEVRSLQDPSCNGTLGAVQCGHTKKHIHILARWLCECVIL